MSDLKFKRISEIGSDETSLYEVTLGENYTVNEFINLILLRTSDWGSILIKNNNHECKYKWGILLSLLPIEDLNKKIKSVLATGGWSQLNYKITTE